MPECKLCGTELEFDDSIDQYMDATVTRVKTTGHCPCCEKHYVWFDVYKFTHYEYLEEVE